MRKNWDLLILDPDFPYKNLNNSEEFINLASTGNAVILGAKVIIQDELPLAQSIDKNIKDVF